MNAVGDQQAVGHSRQAPAQSRVLIDAMYGGQRRGTGLSTYARNLAAALGALGHEVCWLSGAEAPARADRLIDEVSLADQAPAARGLRQQLQTVHRMAAGVLSPTVNARRVAASGVVIGRSYPDRPAPTFLAPNLFVNAHYRNMLLRSFTEVRLPEPVDVLHLSAPLPVAVSGARMITTIHDLVPLRLPYTTPDNKQEFLHRVRTCAAKSDVIVTVSEASKADIVTLLGVDPGKIVVTHQPTDLAPLDEAERASIPRVLSRFGLAEQGYALFVGAIEPKKNVRRMIEAFLSVDTPMPLAIVGPRAWMWESEIGDLQAVLGDKAYKRLRFLDYVDREDLRRLYAGAQFFLFPSLYEGFGLPALEAMTAGCPVITSATSSLPEVCGDAALYVDPFERDDIVKSIERLISDASLRSALAQKGHAQARLFSFDRYVVKVAEAYARLDA